LKLFSKGLNPYNSLIYLLIYVISASTVDHSTLLSLSISVGFERFTGKRSDLLQHINKSLVELTKMQ